MRDLWEAESVPTPKSKACSFPWGTITSSTRTLTLCYHHSAGARGTDCPVLYLPVFISGQCGISEIQRLWRKSLNLLSHYCKWPRIYYLDIQYTGLSVCAEMQCRAVLIVMVLSYTLNIFCFRGIKSFSIVTQWIWVQIWALPTHPLTLVKLYDFPNLKSHQLSIWIMITWGMLWKQEHRA